jgi:hypothetical protein
VLIPNLGRDYSDWDFHGFSQILKENAGTVPLIRSWPTASSHILSNSLLVIRGYMWAAAEEPDSFQRFIKQWNYVLIFNFLLQNEWTLNAILFHIHFIASLFRFEQRITKTLPVIAYTLFQPGSQVSQCSPRHVSGITEICFRIAILRSLTVSGLVVYTFALRYPQRKWSQAKRLGERAGHGTSPRSEITRSGSISWTTYSVDALAVGTVALSY